MMARIISLERTHKDIRVNTSIVADYDMDDRYFSLWSYRQGDFIRSSIQASSLSLGTIIRFPMVMVGKSLECIRVYALAREIPSTAATSSAFNARGS